MPSESELILPAEGSVYKFADPMPGDPDGFVGRGGDLSPQCLVDGYSQGCFPWYSRFGSYHWYSPDPRMVLFPSQFQCSKSLKRVIKSGKFEVRIDTCFRNVITNCSAVRYKRRYSSWITPDYIEAYSAMHELGLAHSFETFADGALVGGLYGLSLGAAFFGESMFHTRSDASKVAFAALVDFCKSHGILLIDAQQETPHLASLGAMPIPRLLFIDILKKTNQYETLKGKWTEM